MITREAIASFVDEGGGDFVNAVACTVPFRVMATLTGVPSADQDLIVRWTNSVMPNADPDYRPTGATAEAARVALSDYCLNLARDQRSGQKPFLSQTLFEGRLEGRELDDEEVANFLDTFLVGGTETTRQLISHGLLALLEHPAQCRRLVEGTVIECSGRRRDAAVGQPGPSPFATGDDGGAGRRGQHRSRRSGDVVDRVGESRSGDFLQP